MSTSSHLEYHLALLKELTDTASKLHVMDAFVEEQHDIIHDALRNLCEMPADQQFYELGQDTLCKIVAAWPQLTPMIARDLFWFFGGDCLQYMPDHEIANYQRLDEARYEAESQGQHFDFAAAKGQIFGLH
ncbi:PA2817 family protein [Simiduia curdlanivorans]|uniref:PA2817 family protein n=1 Tax=Simiduia curdlanivorans TaxID=1492769 RepID=A0ABV8V3E2_9GAMM|nr:PA2817 family protein [Simiduia curdlanivorans]MDN3640153.1 PA2817 family protein [Simiduia curdlanivorans]